MLESLVSKLTDLDELNILENKYDVNDLNLYEVKLNHICNKHLVFVNLLVDLQ